MMQWSMYKGSTYEHHNTSLNINATASADKYQINMNQDRELKAMQNVNTAGNKWNRSCMKLSETATNMHRYKSHMQMALDQINMQWRLPEIQHCFAKYKWNSDGTIVRPMFNKAEVSKHRVKLLFSNQRNAQPGRDWVQTHECTPDQSVNLQVNKQQGIHVWRLNNNANNRQRMNSTSVHNSSETSRKKMQLYTRQTRPTTKALNQFKQMKHDSRVYEHCLEWRPWTITLQQLQVTAVWN